MINILLHWDGVGLVSYMFFIHCMSFSSYGGGIFTVLSNRIGDVALLVLITWIINFGSRSFIYNLQFFRVLLR